MIRAGNRKSDGSYPSVALTDDVATSGAIAIIGLGGSGFQVTALATAASLTWYVSHDGITYAALYDRSGSAVAQSGLANTRAFPIPDECFAFPFAKAKLDAGTATIRVCGSG